MRASSGENDTARFPWAGQHDYDHRGYKAPPPNQSASRSRNPSCCAPTRWSN